MGHPAQGDAYTIESDLTPYLSARFACPALCAAVSDDDYLWYELYASGKVLDFYGSDAWYFRPPEKEAEWHLAAWPPVGGNAALLCTTFGVPENVEFVEKVLRYLSPDTSDDIRNIWFGQDRHENLVRALRLPLFAARKGYFLVEHGAFWFDEVDPERFIKT